MLYIYNLYLHITYNNKVVTVTAMMPHPTIQTNSFSRVDHLSRTSHCSRDFHNITHQGTKPPDVDQVWKSIRTKPGKGSISLEFLECKATHFGGAYYIFFFFLAVLHPYQYQYQSISFWILMHKGKHIQTFWFTRVHSSLELTVGTDLTNPDLHSPVPFCDLQHKFDMYQDVLLLGAMEIWRKPTGRHCMAH